MTDSKSETHLADMRVDRRPASDSESESVVAGAVHDDQTSDTSESEDSGAEDGGAFLDIEALEDGFDDDDSDDNDNDESSHSNHIVYSFPQFSRLPIELRHRVWDYFDPHMRTTARLVDVTVEVVAQSLQIWAGPNLLQRIAPARALLSTHSESRALALRFYPHNAVLSRGVATIPCDKTRDIIHFVGCWDRHIDKSWAEDLAGPFDGFTHIAFENTGFKYTENMNMLGLLASGIISGFPALQTIYLCTEDEQYKARSLQWCVLDSSHHFYLEFQEEQPGVGEDVQYMYCWPKTAKDAPPLQQMGRLDDEDDSSDAEGGFFAMEAKEGRIWAPMIQFAFETGVQRFDKIKEAVEGDGISNYESGDDSDTDTRENEYESEGIDDSEIDDEESASDSEDDLIVQRSSPHEQESTFGGFSPLEGEKPVPSIVAENVRQTLSSTGPESINNAETSGSESEAIPTRQVKRRKRRIMSDSDEEPDGGSSTGVTRMGRQTRPVDSDSESDEQDLEHQSGAPTKGRQARIVLSDSEDEEVVPAARTRRTLPAVVQTDSDSAEQSQNDESDESSDENEQPKKLSLAERIGAFRAEVPAEGTNSASESEYDEFNDEGDGEIDYGRGGPGTFQDDDEGDESSDNDNMIMDMAEEGSEDGEEEW